MEREEYKQLPLDYQLKYLQVFQELMANSVSKRMEILPSVSALSAMLLIVATFGDKLIPFNNLVKTILSLLLLIIPIALFFYNLDLKTAQKKNQAYIEKFLDLDLKEELKKEKQTISLRFTAVLPDIIIFLLFAIIIIIIYLIWTQGRG